jgi:Zn-dependent protease
MGFLAGDVFVSIMPGMFLEQLSKDPSYFIAVCVTVIFSICLHELAHGVVAIWLGDRTPIETGHMTLNPLVHMGAMSFVMLAVVGIAWGAMPVNPTRLRGRHGRALVALAGPATNVVLAFIALLGLGLWMRFAQDPGPPSAMARGIRELLWVFGVMNIALAIFNMLPVPPLDGSRVLADFSHSYARLIHSAGQGAGIAFLLIFFFAGTYISKAAAEIAVFLLTWIRGY